MNEWDAAVKRLNRAVIAVYGPESVQGWIYQTGSVANGISWSLSTGRGGSFSIVGLPFDQLGKTRRDAIRTLDTLAAAFESIDYHNRTRGGE